MADFVFANQIHPEDREMVEGNLLKMKNGEAHILRCEFRLKHVKGHYSNIEDMAIAVKDKEGKVYKIIGSMIDQSGSLEQKGFLRTAGSIAKLAPIDIDIENNELRNISQALAEIFDKEIQQLSLLDSDTKFFNEREKKWETAIELIKSINKAVDLKSEVKIRTNKNAEKWIRVHYSILVKNNEPYRLIGIVQDITKVRQSRVDLKESSFWLKKSQEIGKVGHFRINLETGQWKASEQLIASMECPSDMAFDAMSWMSFVHPNYREELQEKFHMSIQNGKGFHMDYEIMVGLNPNKIISLEVDTEVIEVNQERFIVGSAIDITERKKNNERLVSNQDKVKIINWKQSHLGRGPLTRLISQSDELLKNEKLNLKTKIIIENIRLSAYEVDATLRDSIDLVEKLDFSNKLKPVIFETSHVNEHIGSRKQIKLFIVDDDPIIRAVHQQILKRAHLTNNIHVLDSGLELLDKLEYDRGILNLILLDLNMPGLSGIKVLEEISKSEAKNNSLVIIVSSSISTLDKVQCASYSFVIDYFEKPFNTDDLKRLKSYHFTI